MLSYFTINNKRPSFYEGLFIWKLSKMKHLIVFLLFVSFFNQAIAQSEHKQTKQQRKAEQKKEQQARASIKAEEKGRKHHISIQSKDVKKRMKRNRKRFDHVDSFDRRPNFFQRLFHRKRPSAY